MMPSHAAFPESRGDQDFVKWKSQNKPTRYLTTQLREVGNKNSMRDAKPFTHFSR
jgi:hypothetical protein